MFQVHFCSLNFGLFVLMISWTVAYSEPCQTSKMELFVEIVETLACLGLLYVKICYMFEIT